MNRIRNVNAVTLGAPHRPHDPHRPFRRTLLGAAAAAGLTAAMHATAQQPGKIWRIGVLSPRALPDPPGSVVDP